MFAASDLSDSPGKDVSNHMKIIFSLGYGCMCACFCKCLSECACVFVCLCACCHVSAAIFFGWFVISSIYLFSVNLCSVLAILLICPWTHTLSLQSTQCLCFWTVGGTATRAQEENANSTQKCLESNPEPFQNKGLFSFQQKLLSTQR